MLAPIHDLPDNVVGVRAIGTVEDDDYRETLLPMIEECLAHHDKIRLLYILGAEFTGFEGEALWEDAKLGFKTFTSYERIAVVTDTPLVRHGVQAFGWLIPGDVRGFALDDLPEARSWITD